ncbi:GFA family protein [Granulosicoccus sp. 3-233]|uniref:GFA family protein n=1 Tax=Granulosicoccus sp. 3-233 TaxID=3417969 RepID=UPI003D34EF50
MTELREGGCVCGKLRYCLRGLPQRVTICHCTWCQRRTGSSFGVELVFLEDQVRFRSGAPSVYRHVSDVSGRWLDQHFCNNCGSGVGLTLEAVPGIQSISAGSLDDQDWLELASVRKRHVYVRSARQWTSIPDDVECFEEHFRP